jgi:branched-chain amino acid transport system permease protein
VSWMIRSRKIWKSVGAAILLLLPLFVKNPYYLHIIISIGLYVLLSLSLNLVTGFTGQLALGHAAFYGLGAYTSALLLIRFGVSYWVALILSAIITGIFGVLLGLPALRLKGDYLGIVTLGFGEIVRLVLVNWYDLTRGPLGLPGIPAPKIGSFVFDSRVPFYYLILVLVIFTVFFMYKLVNSGVGMAMITVKEDEIAAQSIGIYPIKYKLLAFSIGAAFAGIAGSFYASYISFISPDTFLFVDSVTILAMVVLGGLGSIPGSIVGAAVLVVIPEFLRFMSNYRMVLFGALMVLIMIYKPQGFWGANKRVRNAYKIQIRGGNDGKSTAG